MVHQVEYNGQMHEFPDEATPEMISNALGLNSNQQKPTSRSGFPIPEFIRPKEQVNPLDVIKSALIGMGKAGQNINEAGYNLFGKKSPVGRKQLDIRSVIGGNKNPSNLENLVEGIGQYSPLMAAGSLSIPASIGSSALYGATQSPEDRTGGAISGGLLGSIPGIMSLAKKINPLQLTSKNLSKEILEGEKSAKEAYSGEKGHYSKLFDEARKSGTGTFSNLELPKLNLNTLSQYVPAKKLESVTQFSLNPSLETAQKSISELGHIIRPLEKKSSLIPYEKKLLNSALDARSHIQENMFKDTRGNINLDLLSKHGKVQSGYSKDVIPYSQDKSIKKFKRGEISSTQLIDALKNKYPITSKHKNIDRRQVVKDALGSKFSQGAMLGTGLGIGGGAAYNLINQLLGKE